MKIGTPSPTQWSQIVIDVAKNMGGFALSNLGDVAAVTFTPSTGVQAPNTDAAVAYVKARDTGVGEANVARLVGAATAYIDLLGGRACMDAIDLRKQILMWGLLG
jgi:hypothetical protein